MKVKKTKPRWNEGQQKVINYNEGAVVVSAVAGSGKTASIINRIARLLKERVTRHENILATTFTKKAAQEMNDRLSKLGINTNRMSVQTFHSFCYQLLMKTPQYKKWEVDDRDKAKRMLKTILSYKEMNWKRADVSLVMDFISSQRNHLIPPEESEYEDMRYVEAYGRYNFEIHKKRLLTFDDMCYFAVNLLRDNEKVRNNIQRKYQYLIVDEFQDVNKAQIELCDIIAHPEYNYMATGDVDQCIYTFRGSIPEFMLEFQKKYDAELIALEYNYRCPPNIFNKAFTCIKNNEKRFTIDAKPSKKEKKLLEYTKHPDQNEQAIYISEKIRELTINKHIRFKDIFILLRTNVQTRPFEEVFTQDMIPFFIHGPFCFYDRKEIKALICYLRLAMDHNDYVSGDFIVNKPFRFISRGIMNEIADNMSERNISYLESCDLVADNYRHCATVLRRFIDIIDGIDKNDSPSETMEHIRTITKFNEWINREDGSEEFENDRISNIDELISSAKRFDTIPEFLDFVEEQIANMLKNKKKKNKDAVQIMTVHKSKGLESKAIFLPDANEGIIPHAKAENLEEERRIWYVGMTRAEDYLYISSTGAKGEKSRFIEESQVKRMEVYKNVPTSSAKKHT